MFPQPANKLCAFALALFMSAAHSASNGPFIPVASSYGENVTNMAISAGRHPNVTSSISFNHYYNGRNETWDWRVNITELDIPNDIYNYGQSPANYSKGNRVANTQFELQWPGSADTTLNDLLSERNLTIYFNAYQLVNLNNITSKYGKSQGGDCSAVLGDKCAQSFVAAATKAGDNGIYQSDLEDCENTFIAGRGYGSGFSTYLRLDGFVKFSISDIRDCC